MASSSSDTHPAAMPQPAQSTDNDVVLAWTVHLLKRHPKRIAPIATSLAGVCLVGFCLFHNLALALLPAAAVAASLSEYLFPIHYTLTKSSVRSRCGATHLEMSWPDVRHAYAMDGGIKLSPLRKTNSRFESMRGIVLRFENNETEVTESVRQLRTESTDHA